KAEEKENKIEGDSSDSECERPSERSHRSRSKNGCGKKSIQEKKTVEEKIKKTNNEDKSSDSESEFQPSRPIRSDDEKRSSDEDDDYIPEGKKYKMATRKSRRSSK
ncbi:hypothetical protein PFISCL1PPCAC_26676, partial [Pristionchus fissidentatus]